VNPASGELLKDGQRIKIQDQPFRLLVVLLETPGRVVTRGEIQRGIWPDNTFVDFDNGLRVAVRKLREALGDDAENPRYVETIPKRGYRLLVPDVQVATSSDLNGAQASTGLALTATNAVHSETQIAFSRAPSRPSKILIFAAALLLLASSALLLFSVHGPRKLTGADTILLAEFTNSTGDPVFDETLRQALTVQLEQSPFLSLISDQRIQHTLRLMGQPTDARLTPDIAHHLCQRMQSAAYLSGSIASFGSQYVLGLKAVSCPTGEVLAEEQQTASSKENVLEALDSAAGKLRRKLGESLSTVEKFDTPLEQATTPSLEALQAYTLGRKTQVARDEFAAAIPFFQRAVRFDPNFAIDYAALGSVYWNIGETVLGTEYARRAHELHAPISEPERFYIESTYYHYVIGNLEKARQIYDVWEQTYPRNSSPRIRLHQLYSEEGKYEDALSQIREAIRIDPSKGGVNFLDLVHNLLDLDRLQEAGATARQAIANGFDSSSLRLNLYQLAFLDNDASEMARQAAWLTSKPGSEGQILELEAEAAAYWGHLKESRNLSRLAVASAMRAEESEIATSFEANAALREALLGRTAEVRLHAEPTYGVSMGRGTRYAAALSFALAGDSPRAQLLADDLARRYPDDTIVNFNYLPTIRAQIALDRKDPARAIELLQSAAPYELGGMGGVWWELFLGPVYVRGQAYLAQRKGREAAAEFQKILDHRGVVGTSPVGALEHLQIGRAYGLSGDKAKAKSAYADFLTLWKDADPDIPILKQAKAEYAKLQ